VTSLANVGRSRRVVVVEDEQSIADAVAARLRNEGYAVEIAADGPSGVDVCERVQPDLVVLDLMFRPRRGRGLQADPAHRPVPVLMLTARDTEADMLVGLRSAPMTTWRSLLDAEPMRVHARCAGSTAPRRGRAPRR
jgi:CheY-like chemotaxis protein